MITSALISQLRRECRDVGKSHRAIKDGDGSSTLFNLGQIPVVENSYSVYKGTSAQIETTNYTIDLDNGDLQFVVAPGNGVQTKAEYKYAHWRDKNWVEAINQGVEELNSRGFFRQVVRNTSIMRISANVRAYNGPSACVDLYEVLESDDQTVSGGFRKLSINWSYQQDANQLVLGGKPTIANRLAISYLRNMQTYAATSASLDVKQDWIEAVKARAKSLYWESMAAKIASQGNATIDEGHFSFTNARTLARDYYNEFDVFAKRKKPTRPAKDFQWHIAGGGVA